MAFQDFHEYFDRAHADTHELSERQTEFLATLETLILAVAFLPEIAAATTVLGALAGVGTVLGGAAAISTGIVLGLDIVGVIHLSESDFDAVKLTNHIAGNQFTMLGGTLGYAIDGEYGMETGIAAGQLTGIIFDASDTLHSAGEAQDLEHWEPTLFHIAQLVKEVREMPISGHEEHPSAGKRIHSEYMDSESMAHDLIHQPGRVTKPIAQPVTDQHPQLAAKENANRQTKLGQSIFGISHTPTSYPPPTHHPDSQPPPPAPTPITAPKPVPVVPVKIPSPSGPTTPLPPLQTPVPHITSIRISLTPSYVGGGDSSENMPRVPSVPDDFEPGPVIRRPL
jgi:hypothetical protein